METASISDHAIKRRKRTKLPIRAFKRSANKALVEGFTLEDAYGDLKGFLNSLWYSEENCNNMRVYNNHVYMFVDNILVTVLNVPKKLFPIIDRLKYNRREMAMA